MIPGISNPMLSSGGSGVVAPNAANWADISATDGYGLNAAVAITGITQAISLQLSISSVSKTPSGLVGYLYAYKSSGGAFIAECAVEGSAVVETGQISPGDEIYFYTSGSNDRNWTLDYTVTIKYRSIEGGSFDTTLDTFTVVLAGDGSA